MGEIAQIQSAWQRQALTSAVLFLTISAILGLIMRMAFVVDMPAWFQYKHIQHAHSHTAMLGWLTACFFVLIIRLFNCDSRSYSRLFWMSQICILGMLISFIVQGYGVISIILSTLFVLISYWWIFKLLKVLRRSQDPSRLSTRFVKTALWFFLLSTLGLWAMGPIMALAHRGSAFYYGSIQFFLHFQFNGWFVFCMIGLILRFMEQHGITYPLKTTGRAYILLTISCLLTYALAVTWSTPEDFIFWINSIGVTLQFAALLLLLFVFIETLPQHTKFPNSLKWIWGIACACLFAKICIQTAVVFPSVATISYTIRNFVIGFIHLLMLGALSTFLFGLLRQTGIDIHRGGIYIFLTGIALTELILFGQGILIWADYSFVPHYYSMITICSAMMVLGLLIISVHLINMEIKGDFSKME